MAKRFARILASLALLTAAFLPGMAADRYTPLPPALDGSMMPYDFAACTQPPWLPDSLTPVYATYVARHGSRYLSGPQKVKPVMGALAAGRNSGTLSETGEAFLVFMNQIIAANEDNWGDLSPIGVKEERLLARRMFDILQPRLAEKGAAVDGVSTFVPRSVMTMYQFTNQLIRINDQITVKTDEGEQFSKLLYCFAADSAYAAYRKKGDWKEVYDEFVAENVPTAPARRLFTDTDLSDKELRKLTFDMYEVLKANRAAGLPAPTTQWMSVEEYRACWRASNLQHYLRNSITSFSDVAAKATLPLLEKLLSDTDSALQEILAGRIPTRLNAYFGHAETLLPLLSLLELPHCNRIRFDLNTLDECWKIQEITPLAANLLVLIAESPTGRFYAVTQINGRTINALPGEPDIIPWQTLRNFWESRIEQYK